MWVCTLDKTVITSHDFILRWNTQGGFGCVLICLVSLRKFGILANMLLNSCKGGSFSWILIPAGFDEREKMLRAVLWFL